MDTKFRMICIFMLLPFSGAKQAFVLPIYTVPSPPTSKSSYITTLKIGQAGYEAGLVNLTLSTSARFPTLSYPTCRIPPCGEEDCPGGHLGAYMHLGLNSTNGSVPLSLTYFQKKNIVFDCYIARASAHFSLSNSEFSIPSQLQKNGISSANFAYCLGDSRGALFLGNTAYYFFSGYQPVMKVSLTYTPLVQSSSVGYHLGLKDIRFELDTSPLPVNSSSFHKDIEIGINSYYTSLPGPVYDAVRKRFIQYASDMQFPIVPGGYGQLDLCFKIRGGFIRGLPSFVFLFKGNKKGVFVGPYNYLENHLDQKENEEVSCLAFVKASASNPASIGIFQQQNVLVEFDLSKKRVGISASLILQRSGCGSFNFEKRSPFV